MYLEVPVSVVPQQSLAMPIYVFGVIAAVLLTLALLTFWQSSFRVRAPAGGTSMPA
jgi:hypothetical protein